MIDQDRLAAEFERHRPRLSEVARRMLGSTADAEDAVQEAWVRLSRSDPDTIDHLGGWLTTVVGRICLDVIRSRRARPAVPTDLTEQDRPDDTATDPAVSAAEAELVGVALQVVLDTLEPAERLAFVLHDLFAVPYDQIADILDRSVPAARQLASRARRRVQGHDPESVTVQRRVVEAFLDAARNGRFEALLDVLDPQVVLRADPFGVAAAARSKDPAAPRLAPEVHGADAIARAFAGRATAAQPALVDGEVGFAWAPRGIPRSVFALTIRDGRIVELDLYADPATLAELDVVLL